MPDGLEAQGHALTPGALAPDFVLSQTSGFPNSLSDFRGQPIVLVFYPPGWNPSRTDQIAQYNKILSQFPDLNAELLDLSVEGDWYQLGFADEQVRMPVVANSEMHGEIARRYGVEGREAIFVIDAEGIIRWRYFAPVGLSPKPDDLLEALRSIAPKSENRHGLTRREFIAATMATAFALSFGSVRKGDAQAPSEAPAPASTKQISPDTLPITLTVNGAAHVILIEPRVTLLDALRERIGLTGSKKGCDHGQCGACTVLVDGRRVLSCLSLAIATQGAQITTIEGLAQGETLHPMQAAFLSHDGFQCGYCTSGQIVSAVGLLTEPCGPNDADVRELMSGNLCRCGAYPNIVDAIQEVRKAGLNAPI